MSRFRSVLFILLALSVVTLGLASGTMAQTSRGTVTGVVTDATGAVIAKATVTLTQKGTNATRETTTNEAGIYRFDAVDLGNYMLSVQASGFATEERTGIDVLAARTLDFDFALKVGTSKETVTVESINTEIALQTSEQVRGATFSPQSVTNLPIVAGDPLTLGQLLPGTVTINQARENSINQDGNFSFAVNGQRPRGNNFMIDGVENNDISVTGPAFTITNSDAVQEVNIQTSNFSAEFGRAGGAVLNEITKSGTNGLHGTATEIYTGSAFAALTHNQKAAHKVDPPRAIENIPDGTIGGPIVIPHLYNGRNKTFFFAAVQWDRFFGDTTTNLRLPTAAGVATLQGFAATCPNAALYLQALASLRGDPTNSKSNISLAVPSAAGTCTGSTRAGVNLETGLFLRSEAFSSLDNNHQIRVDHIVSQKQTMSFRWLYDKFVQAPGLNTNTVAGFDNGLVGDTLTGAFTDTYVISSRMTNEFRFNFGRIGFNFPLLAADSFHATLPNYAGVNATALGVANLGGATNIPQYRFANNWQYQDTFSIVRGKHTFRFGGDFLKQQARQHPPFNERGSFQFAASSGAVTAFSNFLDGFGGNGGSLNRQFGSSVYHPNLFRQSYFFQDSWKTSSNLTLNLGLRYENFGTPVNTFAVGAFTNYDPVNFAAPHKVPGDNNNFAPTLGFAWNPKGSNFIDRMMGGGKMVWRGGFQVSYDTWFNNLLSNIAGSSPNTLGGVVNSIASGAAPRGSANFTTLFAGILPTAPTALSPQSNLFLLPFVNPYTDRWSLGFEREMPYSMIWDASYVGSVSHKLFRSIDMNPFIGAIRFQPQVGARSVRASSANSNYEGLQLELKRSFKSTPVGPVQFQGSYTYAHFLDDVSDVFGFDSTSSSLESISQVLGVSQRIDYGSSDFDRRHVGSLAVIWDVRGPKTGILGTLVGGWTLSAIPHWQTGFPFTLANGTDRNGDGQSGPDRPDISNPAAPFNTRAVLKGSCATGYGNPDVTGIPCIDPSTVHFIEGTGTPNANTVGRNTLRAPGYSNLDAAIAKRFKFGERRDLMFRAEMFNAFNATNFSNRVAPRTINGSALGTFLDVTQTESYGRTMRMRLSFNF